MITQHSSNQQLRVLILAPKLSDAERIKEQLQKAGVSYSIKNVRAAQSFFKQIKEFQPDVILFALDVKSNNVHEILSRTISIAPFTPLLFISEKYDDETIVDLVTSGASDVMGINNLQRLNVALKLTLFHSLRNKEREQTLQLLREKEEQFRLITESVDDLIALIDINGKRIYNNPAYKKTLGDPEKLRGTDSFVEIHPDDRENIKNIFNESIRTGAGKKAEFRFLLRDGTIRFIESQGNVIKNAKGKPSKIVVVSRDITERKLLEKNLRENELRYRTLLETMNEGLMQVDNNDVILYANERLCEMLGYARSELLGNVSYRLLLFEENQTFIQQKNNIRTKGISDSYEIRMRRKNGDAIWLRISGAPVEDDTGNVIGSVGILTDITKQKQSENALARHVEQQKKLLEISRLMLSTLSLDELLHHIFTALRDILKYNHCGYYQFDAATQMFHPHLTFGAKQFTDSALEWSFPLGAGITSSVFVSGKAELVNNAHLDARSAYPKENLFLLEHLISLPIQSKEQIFGVINIGRTEQPQFTQEEFELAQIFGSHASLAIVNAQLFEQVTSSVEKYRQLFEDSKDAVYISTPEGKFLDMNPAGVAMLGYHSKEEVQNIHIGKDMYFNENVREYAKQLVEYQGFLKDFEYVVKRKDGRLITVLETATPVRDAKGRIIAYRGMMRDITDRKRTEDTLRNSEKRFRETLENLRLITVSLDQRGNITYCNNTLLKLCGKKWEDVIGKNWFEHFLKDDVRDTVKEIFYQGMEKGNIPVAYENEILSANNEPRLIAWNNSLVHDFQGNIIGTSSIGEDITEKKRAEKLQSAVFRISQAADSAAHLEDVYVSVHNIIKEVMPANNFYISLYDEKTNTVSFPYFKDEVDTPDEPRQLRKGLTEYVLRTGTSLLCDETTTEELTQRGEIELIGVPSPIWLGVPLIVEKKTIGVMAVQHYTDEHAYGKREQAMLEFVSSQIAKAIEKKKSEEQLKQSEERYRRLVETLPDAIAIHVEGKIVYANDAALKLVNAKTAEELIGKPVLSFVAPEFQNIVKERLKKLIVDKESVPLIEEKFIRLDGKMIDVEVASIPFMFQGKHGAQVVMRDITERKRSEEALLRSEEQYRDFFEEDITADFICSVEGKFLAINPSFIHIFGYAKKEDAITSSFASHFQHEDDFQSLLNLLREQKKLVHHEMELCKRDGTPVYVIANLSGIFSSHNKLKEIKGYFFDITDRKKLELQLLQSQKMESLGQLSSGIAHDFNNVLAGILGYAELNLRKLNENDLPFRNTKNILQLVERGQRITKQLLAFSRRQLLDPRDINLNVVISDLLKLISQTLGENIEIQFHPDTSLRTVNADPTQIEQVIMNLFLNARDAMPNGGTLSIATRNFQPNEEFLLRHQHALPTQHVELSVTDSGIGMSEKTQERMFEPFFTTKAPGKGTGLGLSMVHGIVGQHKGVIEVESAVHKGTMMRIYLPAVERPAEELMVKHSSIVADGNNYTILLVEDDENVRDVVDLSLQEYGYNIITANNGIEGLSKFQEHSDSIGMIISDVIMPRMGGKELYDNIHRINPSVKFLFVSGYTAEALHHDFVLDTGIDFLHKPFNITELINKVQEILKRKN
jgi:PAS domain S-box-containing protein